MRTKCLLCISLTSPGPRVNEVCSKHGQIYIKEKHK